MLMLMTAVAMAQTQPFGEDGPEYLPMECRGCGMKRHKGCQWMCARDNVCGLCDEADVLRQDVCNNNMAAVSSLSVRSCFRGARRSLHIL